MTLADVPQPIRDAYDQGERIIYVPRETYREYEAICEKWCLESHRPTPDNPPYLYFKAAKVYPIS